MNDRLERSIETDPDRFGGKPVIAGTRMTVSEFLAELANGRSIEDIADDRGYPIRRLKDVLYGLSESIDADDLNI